MEGPKEIEKEIGKNTDNETQKLPTKQQYFKRINFFLLPSYPSNCSAHANLYYFLFILLATPTLTYIHTLSHHTLNIQLGGSMSTCGCHQHVHMRTVSLPIFSHLHTLFAYVDTL